MGHPTTVALAVRESGNKVLNRSGLHELTVDTLTLTMAMGVVETMFVTVWTLGIDIARIIINIGQMLKDSLRTGESK